MTPRATSRLNGRTIEIDVMAYDNGSRNELYIVEVKSHLTREGIDQILKLDFVHVVMPAQAPASQHGQSQRHFSMS